MSLRTFPFGWGWAEEIIVVADNPAVVIPNLPQSEVPGGYRLYGMLINNDGPEEIEVVPNVGGGTGIPIESDDGKFCLGWEPGTTVAVYSDANPQPLSVIRMWQKHPTIDFFEVRSINDGGGGGGPTDYAGYFEQPAAPTTAQIPDGAWGRWHDTTGPDRFYFGQASGGTVYWVETTP